MSLGRGLLRGRPAHRAPLDASAEAHAGEGGLGGEHGAERKAELSLSYNDAYLRLLKTRSTPQPPSAMLSSRVALGSRVSPVSNGSASRASAKASWCPGAAPGGKLDPAYLNGTIPGDFGELGGGSSLAWARARPPTSVARPVEGLLLRSAGSLRSCAAVCGGTRRGRAGSRAGVAYLHARAWPCQPPADASLGQVSTLLS